MFRRYLLASLLAVLILTACGGAETEREVRRLPTSVNSSQINPVSEDELYRFFAVAFGAAPGTLYMSQLREAAATGLDLRTIVNIFTTKSQFLERYPTSLSSQAFAERLVRDIVKGSATEAAQQMAISDVREALAQGLSRGDVIHAIVNNLASKPSDDPYWAGTARLLKNQIIYARHFTDSMQSSSTDLPSLQRVLNWLNRDSSVQGDLTSAIQEALKPTHLVFPAPTMLPDLKDKFTKLCGNQVAWHIQTGVAMNLSGHLDGRKDIMLSLWCAGVQGSLVVSCGTQQSELMAVVEPGGHVGRSLAGLSTCPRGGSSLGL